MVMVGRRHDELLTNYADLADFIKYFPVDMNNLYLENCTLQKKYYLKIGRCRISVLRSNSRTGKRTDKILADYADLTEKSC